MNFPLNFKNNAHSSILVRSTPQLTSLNLSLQKHSLHSPTRNSRAALLFSYVLAGIADRDRLRRSFGVGVIRSLLESFARRRRAIEYFELKVQVLRCNGTLIESEKKGKPKTDAKVCCCFLRNCSDRARGSSLPEVEVIDRRGRCSTTICGTRCRSSGTVLARIQSCTGLLVVYLVKVGVSRTTCSRDHLINDRNRKSRCNCLGVKCVCAVVASVVPRYHIRRDQS